MSNKERRYNHNRDLESFSKEIDIVDTFGFDLRYVTQMNGYDVYVFDTQEIANEAMNLLGFELSVMNGYWYGKLEFLNALKDYERSNPEFKVRILEIIK
jgi:hypothetical protein